MRHVYRDHPNPYNPHNDLVIRISLASGNHDLAFACRLKACRCCRFFHYCRYWAYFPADFPGDWWGSLPLAL